MFNIKEKLKSFVKSLVPFQTSISFRNIFSSHKDIDLYKRWVFKAVRLVADVTAQIDWDLYKVNSKKEVYEVVDHPLLSLLHQFNKKFTKIDSVRLSIIYLLLQGRSPWIMFGDRKPTEMWVVPPNNLQVVEKDDLGYPVMYEYRVDNKNPIRIPAGNVLDIKNPDPKNPAKGLSYISSIRDVVETDEYMMKWNKNLMLNSARPSAILETEKKLSSEEAQLARKMIEETYGGYENAHKVAVLSSGTTLKNVSIPPKDLEFIKAREMNRDEVLSTFGVSKLLLGMEGSYNKASAQVLERVFAEYTIEPLAKMITEQLNEFLLPRYGTDLYLDYKTFIRKDRETDIEEWSKGWNKWLTINEIREEKGINPLEGGDDLWLPINIAPSVTGEKQSKAKSYIKIKGNGEAKITDDGIQVKNRTKIKNILKKVNIRNNKLNYYADDFTKKFEQKIKDKKQVVLKLVNQEKKKDEEKEEIKKKWYDYAIRLKRRMDEGWSKIFKDIFDKQQNIILDNIKHYKSEKADIDVEELMFDKNDEIKATMTIIEPKYYATMETGAETAAIITNERAIGVDKIPEVQKWVKKITKKYATEITNVTYERVLKELKTGLEAGESLYGLGNRVEDIFKNMKSTRSTIIARTESARAMTSAEAYAYDKYGYKELEWYLAGSNPCETCVSLSGQTWTTEKAKLGTIAYSHPNCECLFLPLNI